MLRLTSDIEIGPFAFNGVTEAQVESSWDNLTDTCTLVFPRRVAWQGRSLATGANPLLERKMPVMVRLGYDGQTTEVFRGFVRDISGEIPVRVECEDSMYLLKQGEVTTSYRSVTLGQLIADVVGSKVPYKVVADQPLGQFRINKSTPAKVLDYIRERYFVRSFFRDGTLYVGWAYVAELQRERKIRFDRNVISHNLEFRQKDTVRLSLKAVVMKGDGKKEEVEIGERDGEKRTFHYYNISAADAKKRLEAEAERLIYTGYRGSFTTFGSPDIRHGDVVDLSDPVYPDRAGRYLVKSVKTTFGTGGYRQEVELESKA
jgi:hypothetical protein